MLARFDEAAPLGREAGGRWRELSGDDEVDRCSAGSRRPPGDHEAAAVHLRRLRDLLEARGNRLPLGPSRPCSAARSASSAATTRPNHSPSSAATSADRARRLHPGALAAGAGARPRSPRRTRRSGEARPRGGRDHRNDRRPEPPGRRALRPRRSATRRRPNRSSRQRIRRGVARYERKHNLAQVAQVRERLAELHHVGLST